MSKKTMRLPETYHTYKMSGKEKKTFFILCGLSLMLAAYVFYKSLLLSLIFLLILPLLIKPYEAGLAQKRRSQLNYEFRDVLYSLSSSISAGRHMPEALKEAKENMLLIYGESGLIVLELDLILKGLFESKNTEEQILNDFARRAGVEDITNFFEIYFTCRSTGGDLERIVSRTADAIMDKITIKREIAVMTAQKKMETKLLTALPFLVIGFLELFSADYISVMFETLQGRLMMTLALMGIGFTYYLTAKITSIEI